MKRGCINSLGSPNPSKADTDGFAGPKRALAANLNLSSFDAQSLDMRRHLVWEAAQWEDTNTTTLEEGPGCPWAVRLPSRIFLGGISTCRQCNTMTSLGRSSGREPRAVTFMSSVQGQNPNICSCSSSCYPDGLLGVWSCAVCGVRPDGQHAWGQLSSAEQNKTKQNGGVWFWLSTQPLYWSHFLSSLLQSGPLKHKLLTI